MIAPGAAPMAPCRPVPRSNTRQRIVDLGRTGGSRSPPPWRPAAGSWT
jgi:hypothetical protein